MLAKHLETFRELESLQAAALAGVKNQGLEGLANLLARQQDVMSAIAREKAGLRPFLDQWEGLAPEVREKLRSGKAGEILGALETVAQAIQAKHQDMFGTEDAGATGQAGASAGGSGGKSGEAGKEPAPPDLSQTINIYRALQ